MVKPSERIRLTYFVKNACRSPSFVLVLIPYLMVTSCLEGPTCLLGGPKKSNKDSHQ